MRRTDHDGHVARQGPPPFRVLADNAYLSPGFPAPPPPPPPRAPEPYKLAPSATSFGKAHRRSSFVILAESSAASAESDNASPTLATGRISPFRGRGFKGPPPHSMSRPQSPEVTGDGRRRKLERRVSVSQQNSPRRSLIPQPTYRQRSTSLTKANERSPSPKIGRRVDSKTRLNISNSRGRLNAADSKSRLSDSKTRLNRSDSRSRANLAEPRIRFISNSTSNLSNSNSTPTRRQPTTRASTRLSPIQGTPTKPEKTNVRVDRARDSLKTSPTKTPRTTSRRSNVAAARRDNHHQDKSSNGERVVSPSKIPLKRNKANGVSLVSSNSGRFISMPEQNSERPMRAIVATKNEEDEDADSQSAVEEVGRTSESNSRQNQAGGNSGKVDDVQLMDLLKQTSHATGTSSEHLVNTTTTTAVQPLHIDANTLHVERNETAKGDHQHDGTVSSVSPTLKDVSPGSAVFAQNASQRSSTPQSENQSKSSNLGHDNRDSPVGAAEGGGHSKSGSSGQTARNVARMNGEGSVHQNTVNQSFANQRAGRNGHNARGVRPSEESETISEVKGGSASGRVTVAGAREIPTSDKTRMENKPRMVKTTAEDETSTNAETTTTTTMSNRNNATTTTTTTTVTKSNGSHHASPAVGAINASVNASGSATRTRNANRGSDASLKSSTGVSTDSIESVRSTDTGVSVNTVRGVSSPREKTGVHVVKRQEIETLSGNIVHVEQNGEPAVLAAGNEKQGDSEKLLARWRRSLGHYCRCCSGMRCLACRRDAKSLLWARKDRPQAVTINDSSPPVAATIAPDQSQTPTINASSCWSKLKTRCRCARLREIKWCTRKSRIAPAEAAAAVCCPPERRFGAICRRAFACCKRPEAQPRTKNARAKHSLTSVAPPPLSEESKTKLPDVLVEHNSVMRGAIPCLPVPLAWFCLIWNVLLPGTGTVWSGLFNLCAGQPRFSATAGMKSRLGAFVVNLVVGVGQLFTVLFCLVGWGWSIWWGITMVRLARKYKRFRASEAASNDIEARGSEPSGGQPPRGTEKAR